MSDRKEHFHQIGRPRVAVTARLDGDVLAQSDRVLMLKEVYHDKVLDPVYYFPPEDVRTERLTPTPTATSCPIKGDASYWSYQADGREEADLVWSYREPIAYSKHIAGRMAFDAKRVSFEVVPVN